MIRFNGILACALFTLAATACASSARHAEEPPEIIHAAERLLDRVAGSAAQYFTLEYLRTEEAHDIFEVEAAGGMVTIRGNSGIALCRGIYHYLREATHSQITWSGHRLNLALPLPDYPKARVESPHYFRLYYNVCTFGYSTPFWGWEEWEREIDWMALHGINMPLAMAGQEAIWQRVWSSFGIPPADLDKFFTGPAYLPWNRMGNINAHDGPLPQSYIDNSRLLQRRILARMEELGMHPVVPAFAGFVPPAFRGRFPDEPVFEMKPWAGFGSECGTYLLSPASFLFREIGRRFITEYQKEYGPCSYFLADSFNEMDPPVSRQNRYHELAEYGRGVYEGIRAGNPNGTWVMQGWMFSNNPSFWDPAAVKALFQYVPDEKMIVVDLANEHWKGWRAHEAFYGKQWINSVIHNFGGNNPMQGPLAFFANNFAEAAADSARGNMIGVGIAPEGIENNEVVYELLTDAAWSREPIRLKEWLRLWCLSRYGGDPPRMEEAWTTLAATLYDAPRGNVRFAFQREPNHHPAGEVAPHPRLWSAVEAFLSCSGRLGSSPLYANDLVEIVAQYASVAIDRYLGYASRLHETGDSLARDRSMEIALDLMEDLDALLSTRPDRRLERWLLEARAWGRDSAEKAYYERDARRLVTTWGGPSLAEYSARLWSGLIRGYYKPRWEQFRQHQKSEAVLGFPAWEERWIAESIPLPPEHVPQDRIAAARALFEKISELDRFYSHPLSFSSVFDSSRKALTLSIGKEWDDLSVRCTLNEGDAEDTTFTYSGPFPIDRSATIRAQGFRDGEPVGRELRRTVRLHKAFGKATRSRIPFGKKYSAGGVYGLTDGQRGSFNYRDGRWQGYRKEDLETVIDLGAPTRVASVAATFLQETAVSIYFPIFIEYSYSLDGATYTSIPRIMNHTSPEDEEAIQSFAAPVGALARYIRLFAKNTPAGSEEEPGADKITWLFIDEIVVE